MGEVRQESKEHLLALSKRLEEHPFSDRYIELCRKYRFNRVFIPGDWYINVREDGIQGPKCWGPGRHSYYTLSTEEAEIIWLPRLDQLYAMYENEPGTDIHVDMLKGLAHQYGI